MNSLNPFAGAKLLSTHNAPGFLESCQKLAYAGGIKKSFKVYHHPTSMPNAFYHPLTNRLLVTDGILKMMESYDLHAPASREMQAVLAHEFGHMKHAFKQVAPVILMRSVMPMTVLASAYLLESTYQRMKGKDGTQPTQFWDEFSKQLGEVTAHPWDGFKDYLAYMYPVPAKLFHAKRYKDETWAQAIFDQAKVISLAVATNLGGMMAAKPFMLKNEWEADRFMIALTQDKEACISAFDKLRLYSVKKLAERAESPLQKSIVAKVSEALMDFINNTVMAHPDIGHRIDFIRKSNPAVLATGFKL